MLLTLPLMLLIATSLAILAVRRIRPAFNFHWLIACGGALIAWITTLVLHSLLPLMLALPDWLPQEIFPESPLLLLDELSWAFTFAVLTLSLSAILTAVARSSEPGSTRPAWGELFGSLTLSAASLAPVLAGNLLALQLTWVILDLAELSQGLIRSPSLAATRQSIFIFSSRVISHLALLWAIIAAQVGGLGTSLSQLDSQITLFVFLAAGIRLGVLPLLPFTSETGSSQVSLLSVARLTPLASTLTLICRAAGGAAPATGSSLYLLLVGLAGLYGGLSWYRRSVDSPDTFTMEPDWITGIGALSLASGLRMQPDSCLAWGIALIFGGGLQFLSGLRSRYLLPVLLAGVLFVTNLPLTPSWFAVQLYSQPFQPVLILFLISHGFLLAGSFQLAWQIRRKTAGFERSAWALHIWGLGLLVLGWLLTIWWTQFFSLSESLPGPRLIASWPTLISIVLAALLFWMRLWRWSIFPRLAGGLGYLFSLEWLYRLVGAGLRILWRVFSLASRLLESQAGILWAFLLLVLLLSLFSQGWPGG